MSSPTVPGAVFGTVGSFLEDARRGTLPDGWLYRREPEDIRLDTPCIFVTDVDAPCDERCTPLVALEHGYWIESLDRQMIESVVECARQFVDPPDSAVMLEAFAYFCRHDAFLPAPGAGPPPPWEETQRRLDREFYDCLGDERSEPKCRRAECGRGAITDSVMCRVHHFEMIKDRPSPFDD